MSGAVVVAVVDYGLGNVRSICGGLAKVGATPLLTADSGAIMSSAGLVLPGVGAFNAGMARLDGSGLSDAIRRFAGTGRPVLGICLGMQMMLEEGDEFGPTRGLGLVRGRVERLPVREKLPHVGWNAIAPPSGGSWAGTVFDGLAPGGTDVYFVHSFAAVPARPGDVACVTEYGGHPFASAIRNGNITGCQFHPEKSGAAGLAILAAYVRSCD